METASQYGLLGLVLGGVFVVGFWFLRRVVLPVSTQWIASEKVRNVAMQAQTNALILMVGEMKTARRERERERAA